MTTQITITGTNLIPNILVLEIKNPYLRTYKTYKIRAGQTIQLDDNYAGQRDEPAIQQALSNGYITIYPPEDELEAEPQGQVAPLLVNKGSILVQPSPKVVGIDNKEGKVFLAYNSAYQVEVYKYIRKRSGRHIKRKNEYSGESSSSYWDERLRSSSESSDLSYPYPKSSSSDLSSKSTYGIIDNFTIYNAGTFSVNGLWTKRVESLLLDGYSYYYWRKVGNDNLIIAPVHNPTIGSVEWWILNQSNPNDIILLYVSQAFVVGKHLDPTDLQYSKRDGQFPVPIAYPGTGDRSSSSSVSLDSSSMEIEEIYPVHNGKRYKPYAILPKRASEWQIPLTWASKRRYFKFGLVNVATGARTMLDSQTVFMPSKNEDHRGSKLLLLG